MVDLRVVLWLLGVYGVSWLGGFGYRFVLRAG